jgi:hypothetical protein
MNQDTFAEENIFFGTTAENGLHYLSCALHPPGHGMQMTRIGIAGAGVTGV